MAVIQIPKVATVLNRFFADGGDSSIHGPTNGVMDELQAIKSSWTEAAKATGGDVNNVHEYHLASAAIDRIRDLANICNGRFTVTLPGKPDASSS